METSFFQDPFYSLKQKKAFRKCKNSFPEMPPFKSSILEKVLETQAVIDKAVSGLVM